MLGGHIVSGYVVWVEIGFALIFGLMEYVFIGVERAKRKKSYTISFFSLNKMRIARDAPCCELINVVGETGRCYKTY